MSKAARPQPAEKPKGSAKDYTGELLTFLRQAHGKTRVDLKGDYFYDGVTAISLHLLLKTRLPGKDILWAWYDHFDRQQAESIYQSLTPLQDGLLLDILAACPFAYDVKALRDSGLLFLPEHRATVLLLLKEALLMRLDACQAMEPQALRQWLTPKDTWTDRHLTRQIQQLVAQPLSGQQRQSIYDQFETGYLKATARQLLDEVANEAYWLQPPADMEEVEAHLIALARALLQQARRLGVYVSRADFEQAQARQAFGGRDQAGSSGQRGRRQGTSSPNATLAAHFAILGLPPHATLDQVKAAWREQVKLHHPDQGGTVSDFLRLQESYEYLLQQVFRK